MRRDHVYYAIIGAGLLTIVGLVIWQVRPEPEEPLDPPEVLVQKLNSNASKEEKVKAARDFIRHGEAARREVRVAVNQHQQYDREVVAPLLQATAKNRDYRSMPTLLKLLEHKDPLVRGRAGAAVQKILGADFGFDARATPEERARVIKMIKEDYQNGMGRLLEFYHDQPE